MKKHAVPIIAAVLLLLPVLYVGSYLALVVPTGYVDGPDFSRTPTSLDIGPFRHYRDGGALSAQIFWPLEQIDRKLRPETWQQAENLQGARLSVTFPFYSTFPASVARNRRTSGDPAGIAAHSPGSPRSGAPRERKQKANPIPQGSQRCGYSK